MHATQHVHVAAEHSHSHNGRKKTIPYYYYDQQHTSIITIEATHLPFHPLFPTFCLLIGTYERMLRCWSRSFGSDDHDQATLVPEEMIGGTEETRLYFRWAGAWMDGPCANTKVM